MTEEKNEAKVVWVFNGSNNQFPSGVFTTRALAEEWIEKHKLPGTLTAYPLDMGVYDWTIERGYFKPKKEYQTKPHFIASFSSAYMEHYHYGSDED